MREVNGQQYQHATMKAKASATNGTFEFKTLTKLEFKVSAPKKPTHDSTGNVDGFTIDKRENTGSMALKLSEWFRFREWLVQNNPGVGVLQSVFDFPFSVGNSVNAIKTYTLRNCMVQDDPFSSSDSQDALMVEIPLFFLGVATPDVRSMIYTD